MASKFNYVIQTLILLGIAAGIVNIPLAQNLEYYITSLSPNKALAVGVAYDGLVTWSLTVWDADTGAVVGELSGNTAPVMAVAWSPDSKRFAAGDSNAIITVWCMDQANVVCNFEEKLTELIGHTAPVLALDWNSANILASGSEGEIGSLRLWDMSNYLPDIAVYGPDVSDLDWKPDNTGLAVSSRYGGIYLFDDDLTLSVNGISDNLITPNDDIFIQSIAWDNTGTQLAYGTLEGDLVVIDPVTKAEIARLEEHEGTVYAIAWSPDNSRIASASADGTIVIWNPTTNATEITNENKDVAITVELSWITNSALVYPDTSDFPVGLPTLIPTSTPIPPTATHTNTPIPPTPTPTNTPIPPLSANAGYDQNHRIPHDGQILGPIYASVTLNGSASTGQILAYEWSRGGNVFSTQAVVNLQLVPGTYVFTLKVSDANDEDTDTVTINVTTCLFAPPSCGGTTENE